LKREISKGKKMQEFVSAEGRVETWKRDGAAIGELKMGREREKRGGKGDKVDV